MEDYKKCTGCQEVKSLSDFNHSKTGKLDRHNHCRECQRATRRKWYLNNKDKAKADAAEYSKTEKAVLYRKKRWQDKKHIIGPNNNSRRKNDAAREAARKQRNEWMKNPENRLAHNARIRVRKALKGIARSESTKEMLGCTFEELKIHLESQFQDGMSWSNYGEWHVDHIEPCASFDLSKEEEKKRCFGYKNLQPLWAKENISKGCTK